MAVAEPIRNQKNIHALFSYFEKKKEHRNHVLVRIGVYTALRIGDILNLRISDVFDFNDRKVKNTVTLTEQKTGKRKTVVLHKDVKRILKIFLCDVTKDAPLILNQRTGKAISREQAHRIISNAAKEIGIPHRVSCHSLRKTFGYLAWRRGEPLSVITKIYNHASYKITELYLGIQQDDINAVYLNMRI